jgi:hypothetical protein
MFLLLGGFENQRKTHSPSICPFRCENEDVLLADNTWEMRLHLYVPLPNQNIILLQPSPCQTGHNHLMFLLLVAF